MSHYFKEADGGSAEQIFFVKRLQLCVTLSKNLVLRSFFRCSQRIDLITEPARASGAILY